MSSGLSLIFCIQYGELTRVALPAREARIDLRSEQGKMTVFEIAKSILLDYNLTKMNFISHNKLERPVQSAIVSNQEWQR